MAVTAAQYLTLLQRITALEQHMNDVSIALNRVVGMNEVQQVFTILQTQVDNLSTDVAALDTRVTGIEEEPRL